MKTCQQIRDVLRGLISFADVLRDSHRIDAIKPLLETEKQFSNFDSFFSPQHKQDYMKYCTNFNAIKAIRLGVDDKCGRS